MTARRHLQKAKCDTDLGVVRGAQQALATHVPAFAVAALGIGPREKRAECPALLALEPGMPIGVERISLEKDGIRYGADVGLDHDVTSGALVMAALLLRPGRRQNLQAGIRRLRHPGPAPPRKGHRRGSGGLPPPDTVLAPRQAERFRRIPPPV